MHNMADFGGFRNRHFSDSDRLCGRYRQMDRRRVTITELETTLANLNRRISSISLQPRPTIESCGSEYSSGFDDMSLRSGSSVDSCFSSVGSLDHTVTGPPRDVTTPCPCDVNHNDIATPTAPNFCGRPDFLQRSFSSPDKFPELRSHGSSLTSQDLPDVTLCDQQGGNENSSGGTNVNVTVSAELKDVSPEQKAGWRTWLRGQTRLSQRDRSNRNKIKLSVFDEAGGIHVVLVNEKTTAHGLIEIMIVRTQSEESVHWTIFEDIDMGRAERIVEDHEVVIDIKRAWTNPQNNKFVFRKDLRKNEPFIHPEILFSEHMKDRKSDKKRLTADAERAREILMMDLVVESDRTPDLQGTLYLKPEGTKKWKKAYCFLRGSGLHYSTKGKTQDPKNLRCFSRLDDVDVFMVKRSVDKDKIPSGFCIILKPKTLELDARMKAVACICVKDESSFTSWLSGLRLSKFGATLRKNFAQRRGTHGVAFLADQS